MKLMGVSKTTVHHWIVELTLHVHSDSLKPILTEENRLAWFKMAMDACDPVDQMRYQDMRDQIHVDEKWFFLMREKEWYLLHHDEKNPKHCVKHKLHITKVMFLCGVVRPRFNTCSNSWWDSKLGIWPIGGWEPVKRKLKNRPKGMPVWKNKIAIKEVYHDLLFTKLILSILEKWPRRDWLSRKIIIQQDRAKNHVSCNNKIFNDVLVEKGIHATLYTQAANSPDVNLLDLGFLEPFKVSMMLLQKTKKNR